jgi:SAM-dependent methyltransferase
MRASAVLDRWYALAYRFPSTPWERAARATTASTGALLDREQEERSRPPGRALDLGCGRGLHTAELARRGWQAVGVDLVPHAIEAARRRDIPGAHFVVGDVTHLTRSGLGTFDFFLDVGCLQGFNAEQRLATGREVTTLANPGATMLILAFQPTRLRALTGAVSRAEVETAFPDWEVLSVDPADTAGLGWPLTTTSPQWLRLRLRG